MSDSKSKGLIDKFLDLIFSNNEVKHLLWVVPLGLVLRIIVANNVHLLGDEMIHGPHAIGFLHSGLISTILQSPLWFLLSDIFYNVLGVTMISARMTSIFYSALTITVVFLLADNIFKNKRIAIVSSFLFAISYYVIRYTLIEMDLSALFFLMLAIYLFRVSVSKNKFPWLAAVCIGIGALIKTLSLFFVPAFIVAFFLYNPGKKKVYDNIKKSVVFGLIILGVFSPILIHNYLWYQDSGLVDTYFAQYFFPSVRDVYAGQLGFSNDVQHFLPLFFKGVGQMSKNIFPLDPLIIILAFIGGFYWFKKKELRKEFYFLLAFIIFGFSLLILSNWLLTHYVTLMAAVSIFAGFSVDKLITSLENKGFKKALAWVFIVILVFQLFLLWPQLSSTTAMSKMKSYANNNMDKDSIVLVDSRIYRGRIAWLFHDFHYLESSYFSQFLLLNQNLSGEDVPVKIYFVECARDDCGWGTVSNNPELNQSSEQIVSLFASSSELERTITGGETISEEGDGSYFKVYSGTISVKPSSIQVVDSTHEWFYYPINYEPKERIFEQYEAEGLLENLLYYLAWLILIASVILSFTLPVLVIYKVFKE